MRYADRVTSPYLPRVVDRFILEHLEHPGAILIEGSRGCGKSATGRHHAKSSVQLDIDPNAVRLAEIDPARLLVGARPRFIDEWQLVPAVWNQVRAAVDTDREARFLLAGSALPADDATRHSGAGRFIRLRMRPLALAESGHSTGAVSLAGLFDDPHQSLSADASLTIEDLAEALVRGGWPGLREQPITRVMRLLSAYLDETARVDISRLEGEPRRDPESVLRLIRALGRHVSTEVSFAALARDSGAHNERPSDASIRAYLHALARVFVVEDQPSWGPHLRSRDRVRKSVKRQFVDPSLAAAATGASPSRLLDDLAYFGQLFESLAVRDLRVYAELLDATVSHYRDEAGREVDAIVERRDGSWIGCEVKLAASREEEAAASLTAFVNKLDPVRTPPPRALVILTAGTYAYTRPDGIHVVPIGVLGP